MCGDVAVSDADSGFHLHGLAGLFAPDGGLGDDSFGPQFVAPAALFLASSLSGDTAGETLSVAGTKLSLYRVQESHGVVGEDPRAPWRPDDILARWSAITRFR